MAGNVPNPFEFDPEDGDKNNPFSQLPIFGEMMKMFSAQGPIQWDTARQVANVTATNGQTEPNVDPLTRIDFTNLAHIAAPQVHEVTGISGTGGIAQSAQPLTVTPGIWAQRTLDDYRPLFTNLAAALGVTAPDSSPEDSEVDPFASMFAGLTNMIAPMTMGMTIGSMVGLLAKKSLGQYDLPLPRPINHEFLIVPGNVDSFASAWDLPRDDVRMWTVIHELVVHQLYSVAHIRLAVSEMVQAYVAAFRPDPHALNEKLSSFEGSDAQDMMSSLQKILGDPELLLGAIRTPEQDQLQPRLDAMLGLVLGWSDHMTDTVGTKILGNPARIAEAVRRQRIEASEETKFVEKLLGLQLNRQQVERGRSFVHGVLERVGESGLMPLYVDAKNLPTMSELDAPGLWLARLEISGYE